MPMSSFIQGAQAGQRLARPIGRGIERHAQMGLQGELDADNRRVAEAERALKAELQRMQKQQRAFELEILENQVQEIQQSPFDRAAKVTSDWQKARRGIVQQLESGALTPETQQELQQRLEAVDHVYREKFSSEQDEPEATVTRELPGGTSVRMKMPASEVEQRFGPIGGSGPMEMSDGPIAMKIQEIDNELEQLDILEAEGKSREGWQWNPFSQKIAEKRQELEAQRNNLLQRQGRSPGRAPGSVGGYVPQEGQSAGDLQRAHNEGRREAEEYRQTGVETERERQETRQEDQARQQELRDRQAARPFRPATTERSVMSRNDRNDRRLRGPTTEADAAEQVRSSSQSPERRLVRAREERERAQRRYENILRTFEGDYHIPEGTREGMEEKLEAARRYLAEIDAEIELLEEAVGETRPPPMPIGGMAP